jgi:hypothetical protein
LVGRLSEAGSIERILPDLAQDICLGLVAEMVAIDNHNLWVMKAFEAGTRKREAANLLLVSPCGFYHLDRC